MQERKKEGASLYVTYDSMKRPVHISIKESGLSGFLAFMREDTAEVLRQGYDPNLWMCHYRFPDRRQIPEIRPQSNDDYLERLSRAARSAGIRAEHQIAMTDMLYCLRHRHRSADARGRSRQSWPCGRTTPIRSAPSAWNCPLRGSTFRNTGPIPPSRRLPGVVFFSDTQHGKMQFEKYMDYHASNFFNPEQQTPSLKIYDVIARPADMAPITDRCFAEAEDGQERRNRFAEAYADPGNCSGRETSAGSSTCAARRKTITPFCCGTNRPGKRKRDWPTAPSGNCGTVRGGREAEGTGRSRMRGKPLFYGRQRRENAPDTKTINAYEYTSHSGRRSC